MEEDKREFRVTTEKESRWRLGPCGSSNGEAKWMDPKDVQVLQVAEMSALTY